MARFDVRVDPLLVFGAEALGTSLLGRAAARSASLPPEDLMARFDVRVEPLPVVERTR